MATPPKEKVTEMQRVIKKVDGKTVTVIVEKVD